jgi:hypothetical protein
MTTSSTDPRQLRQRTGAPAARAGGIPLQRQRVRAPARPDGLAQLTAMVQDGFAGLHTTLHAPRRTALWGFWLIGIIGDSATTLAMVGSGAFEEGNPAASFGMGFLGLTGYVVVATLLCLVMATISTGRATGPIARVAVGFLLLVGLGKITMAVSNLTLWATLH